jgi:ketosteroid isomerase-like protein
MSEKNVETVRRLFKAVEERDLAGVLAAYDENIVIREAKSLPYGGEFHGHEGGQRHALGALGAWENLQPPGERTMNAKFLDAGEDYVIVLWRQRGVRSDGENFNAPVVSVYKMGGGKIVESQMFQADTNALLQFMVGKN